MDKHTKILRAAVMLVMILIFTYIYNNLPIYNKMEMIDYFNEIKYSDHVAIAYIIITVLLTVFFVPVSWFVGISAVFFGLARGFIYSLLAATISAFLCFCIARIIKGDSNSSKGNFITKVVKGKIDSKNYAKLAANVENHSLKYMFFLRNVPLVPFTILNYLSGLSGLNWRTYILGSVLGMIPGLFISTFFFTRAVNVMESPGEALFGTLVKVGYLGIILIWEKKSRNKSERII